MDRPGDGRSGVEIYTSPKLALSLSSSVGQDKLTFQCLDLLIHEMWVKYLPHYVAKLDNLYEEDEPCQVTTSEVKSLSRVQLFATRRTVVYQAPLSMGFSRQEYWSGLPFPSPADLPTQDGTQVPCMAGGFFTF